jgi:hypothetical protein
MQSRLSRKPRERSIGGPFFDEAPQESGRLYAEEIAGWSPSATLECYPVSLDMIFLDDIVEI